MNEQEQLLFTRQSARLAELETWVALLVMALDFPAGHGHRPGDPYMLTLPGPYVQRLRSMLREGKVGVAIEYDSETDEHSVAIV